jgi:hypothetical protein
MRAAADLIDRSGITGLSVTCSDGHISIQVVESSGDARDRAATVARLAGFLGSTAVQDDTPTAGCSWIRASGTAGGLPVEIFTALTVQETSGKGPQGQRLLLAAAPDGRIAQTAPPVRLPAGWRWLTDLDPAHPPAATARPSGHAAQIAARDFPPLTSTASQAVGAGADAAPSARSGNAARRVPRQAPR